MKFEEPPGAVILENGLTKHDEDGGKSQTHLLKGMTIDNNTKLQS